MTLTDDIPILARMHQNRRQILWLALLLLGVAACSDTSEVQDATNAKDTFVLSDPPFAYTDSKADSVVLHRFDLDGDHVRDVVVHIRPTDSISVDSVTWFVYDKATESFLRGQTLAPGTVSRILPANLDSFDGVEIVVECVDPWMDMRSVTVIGFVSGETRVFESGNPTFDSVGSISVLALHNAYWPFELSRAESVEYVDSLVVFGSSNSYSNMLNMYISNLCAEADSIAIAELSEYETFSDRDFVATYNLYAAFAKYYLYSNRVLGADSTLARIDHHEPVLAEYLPDEYLEALRGIVANQNIIQ